MADFFNKMKSTINKTTKEIGVKSSVMMETSKLKSDISALKKEKTDLFTSIGSKIYEMKMAGRIDLSQTTEMLQKIEELDLGIQSKEQLIEEAQKKKEEELTAINSVVPSAPSIKLTCSCGAVLSGETKFCSKCGKPVVKPEPEIVVEAVVEETSCCGCGDEDCCEEKSE